MPARRAAPTPLFPGASCVLAVILFVACAMSPDARGAEEKHITIPFKTVKTHPWAEDLTSYRLDIVDPVHGPLTLTMRVTDVTPTGYTLAAEGTDYRTQWPLPSEDRAGAVLAAKRASLGEPLDAKAAQAFIEFCIAAGYFHSAEMYLVALKQIPDASRAALNEQIRAGRAEQLLERAKQAFARGDDTTAGRLLTIAAGDVRGGEPPISQATAERLEALRQKADDLRARMATDAKAKLEWSAKVDTIRAALKGAKGEDAAQIERMLPDLDGPLSPERRRAIIAEVHLHDTARIGYSQALEALRAFSFAVRYGQDLTRTEVPALEEFFAAETLVNAYLDAPSDERADEIVQDILDLRGLTDKAFLALVRRGARVGPPPQTVPRQPPQGPYHLKARADELEVATEYLVMLPADYHPSQRRPLVIALHGMNAEATTALQLWADQVLARGWIVAAPELVIGRGKGYMSSPEERKMALRTLEDCARQFAVDLDRVYLAGHSMGGHMTWDVALTYPDRFAAAMPFIGCMNGLSAGYFQNLATLPLYCVEGENDGPSTRMNRLVYQEAKKRKFPMVYREFEGRGHEAFLEEIPKALDWAGEQQRPAHPKQVDFVSAETETSKVHWLQMLERPPERRTQQSPDPVTAFNSALRSSGIARLQGSITGENRVRVQAYHMKAVRIFLADSLFDLQKPLRVSVNGRPERVWPVDYARRKLLEIARQTGDRQRLYWGWVDVPVTR